MSKNFIESVAGLCATALSIGVSLGIAVGIPKLIDNKHVEKVNNQRLNAANTAIKAAREGDEEKAKAIKKAHDKMTYGVPVEK